MILNDKGIEDYIQRDITRFNLDEPIDFSKLDPEVTLTLREKLKFRKEVSQKISIAKLNYLCTMLRKVFEDLTLPLPENYSDKLKQMVKNSNIAGGGGAKRADSNKSFFSMVSKTNMSSVRTDDDSYDD
jgi:hypothetical protein